MLSDLDGLEGALVCAQQAASAKCLVHIWQLVWLKLDECPDSARIARETFLASVAHGSINGRDVVICSNHGKTSPPSRGNDFVMRGDLGRLSKHNPRSAVLGLGEANGIFHCFRR
jgi:hypothetical protein